METKPGSSAPPPLAQVNAATQNGAASPGATAADRAVQYKGLKGGKPRADGLTPGSPEAKQADREKNTERVNTWRANQRAKNPPVLPPTLPAANGKYPPPPPAPQAQGGNEGTLVAAPPIPWQPDLIRPLFQELIPIWEQSRVKSKTSKAVLAKLPPELLKQIEQDSRFPEAAKVSLLQAGPAVAAKYANMLGISADHQGEVVCCLALFMIWNADSATNAKLDELIALRKKQEAAPVTQPGAK